MLRDYSFDLYKEHGIPCFAIVAKGTIEQIPREIKAAFTQIYEVKIDNKEYLTELDFSSCCLVMRDIVNLYGKEVFVTTFNEDNVMLCGQIKNRFSLYGCLDFNAQRFRDKALMKSLIRMSGISLPKDRILELSNINLDSYEILKQELKDDFIVKPQDAAGAFGFFHIRTKANFKNFLDFAILHEYQEYIAEEYIDLPLYHADVLVYDSNIEYCFYGRYNLPLAKFQEGKNIGSVVFEPVDSLNGKLSLFISHTVKALGVKNGLMHIEFFLDEAIGVPIFLEAAMRPGGAKIITMHTKTYEINLVDQYILQNCCDFVSMPALKERKRYAFWLYVPTLPGIVKNLVDPKIKSQYEMDWVVNKGDQLSMAVSMRYKSGVLFAWHENYEILQKDFITATESALLVTQPA